jgi:hypothetical protein
VYSREDQPGITFELLIPSRQLDVHKLGQRAVLVMSRRAIVHGVARANSCATVDECALHELHDMDKWEMSPLEESRYGICGCGCVQRVGGG